MTISPHRIAVVFAGGDPVDASRPPPLPADAVLIAADGGLAQAERLGLEVDVVVGDMDSVSPASLDAAIARGAEAERHPRAKDATDLELALARATRSGCDRIIVIGGLGGRIDHLIGNALLLATAVGHESDIEWWADSAHVSFVRPGRPRCSAARSGDIVSLIPVGGPASGVSTEGLRWSLEDATLDTGSTRGISNQAVEATFSVAVSGGTLVIVHHPEEEIS
jgi:thiamine pyrophosphokinase